MTAPAGRTARPAVAPAGPPSPRSGPHPLARLGGAALVMGFAFVTLDALTPILLLAAVVAGAWLVGAAPRTVIGRVWPLLAAAVSVGVLNALLSADPTGSVIWSFGPLTLTTDSLLAGASIALRLFVIALVAALAFVGMDATELVDALVQQLRVSPRFAIGAMPALRAAPIFRREWQILALAERARGIDVGRSPLEAAAQLTRRSHALLVAAVRRGVRVAEAMDARGFGAHACRTSARERPMRRSDWLLLAGAAAAGAAATAVSVGAGTWRFLLS